MSNSITSTTNVGDHSQGAPQRDPGDRSRPPNPAPQSAPEPNPADYRLIIESGESFGSFIYKTIDARTGEVIRQLPREAMLDLRDRADYHAGDVIRARA